MITHTFYALVLYQAQILYNQDLGNGYFLFDIKEKTMGKIIVEFKKGNKKKGILFVHKDFNTDRVDYQTNNWFIVGEKSLVEFVGKKILDNEHEDFNFFKTSEEYIGKIFGVVLTITTHCNLACYYCFNDYDYNLDQRNFIKPLTFEQIKGIVDDLYKNGCRDIIISGGEPLLHYDFFNIIDYCLNKGIYVRVNTNGDLLNSRIVDKIIQYPINLMVSIHEFNEKDYAYTNVRGFSEIYKKDVPEEVFYKKFRNKIENLKIIYKYPNINLEFMTILDNKNIINLEKIYDFCLNQFGITQWHFFRLYSTKISKGISKGMMSLAIRKLYNLNKKYNVDYKIVDAVPFCVTRKTDLAEKVIEGELADNHNVKFIITNEGGFQLMSGFDTVVGSVFEESISELLSKEFTQKMLNNGFLPNECLDCVYKNHCKGGSRMEAHIATGSYADFDPLGKIANKKCQI
ncbi:radical SAM/SPASM domain-containing protein [Candidatus Absconditicoccus praedator]|uniref:radical SAM/SPASM domain-containing protein n=1 Tax=Candidatus Absconditicoccus praedator TaxID=2735562 RepID=UPI001E3A146E|nr:radical SAM protein [Candidatus Absconditicoccus praedator]UFX83294.1 radical SAM protein [Candidatus Absconditicoccus praedator]